MIYIYVIGRSLVKKGGCHPLRRPHSIGPTVIMEEVNQHMHPIGRGEVPWLEPRTSHIWITLTPLPLEHISGDKYDFFESLK